MSFQIQLAALTAAIRPGSRDAPWTWADEATELWFNDTRAMLRLLTDLHQNGQQEPVTYGDDSRLWDGHHRIVALMALGAPYVLVRMWKEMDDDAQMDALGRRHWRLGDTAMTKVSCPTCQHTIQECRRYRLEPLAAGMGVGE